MTQLSIRIGLLIGLFLATATHGIEKPTKETIVFEGTVVGIAPEPAWVSGITAVYRLVKYRVEHVCKGHYPGPEIVVDHLW
jgi:hypothetical protein